MLHPALHRLEVPRPGRVAGIESGLLHAQLEALTQRAHVDFGNGFRTNAARTVEMRCGAARAALAFFGGDTPLNTRSLSEKPVANHLRREVVLSLAGHV